MKAIQIAVLLLCCLSMSRLTAQTMLSTPPKNNGWYKIQVVQTGKFVSIENASREKGARIIQWDDANSNNQKFLVRKNDDGSYCFFAVHSRQSICAAIGNGNNGDQVVQNTTSFQTGKWFLNFEEWKNCTRGFKINYNSVTGIPIQLAGEGNGAAFQLRFPKHEDAETECVLVFAFIETTAPPGGETIRPTYVKPAQTIKKKDQL